MKKGFWLIKLDTLRQLTKIYALAKIKNSACTVGIPLCKRKHVSLTVSTLCTSRLPLHCYQWQWYANELKLYNNLSIHRAWMYWHDSGHSLRKYIHVQWILIQSQWPPTSSYMKDYSPHRFNPMHAMHMIVYQYIQDGSWQWYQTNQEWMVVRLD